MNVRTVVLLIAGFSGLLLSGAETAAASSVNLVKDGNFSMKQTSSRAYGRWWVASLPKDCKLSYDTKDFKSSPKSLRLESCGKTIAVRQNLPDLKPDTKYKVSFFMKTEGVIPREKIGGARLNICSDRNHWVPAKFQVGTQSWTRYELEFTSGPETNGKVQSYILLYLMNASGKVWFDDIQITEVK